MSLVLKMCYAYECNFLSVSSYASFYEFDEL